MGSHDDFTGWERIEHLPFEPRRGFHASLAQHDGGRLLSVKGAPEVLLPRCTHWLSSRGPELLGASRRATLEAEVQLLASKGYRVLAVAERVAETGSLVVNGEHLRDMHFCGLVAFANRVRPSARAAVHELKRAGVDVIVGNGDRPGTARTIASELGMANGRGVLTGPELAKLDDAALDGLIAHTAIFARVTPVQKVRIVAALQRAGKVVAMTGDGANDAPAIRLADVGIALRANSTPAARAAADMVVTDERIETIVHAILEGRALWASVRDAVSILVGGNVGEILFTLGAGLIEGQSPLNPRQLLLVNLVTDTLPALAIALRPPAAKTPEQLLREGPESSPRNISESRYRLAGWHYRLVRLRRRGWRRAPRGAIGVLAPWAWLLSPAPSCCKPLCSGAATGSRLPRAWALLPSSLAWYRLRASARLWGVGRSGHSGLPKPVLPRRRALPWPCSTACKAGASRGCSGTSCSSGRARRQDRWQ